ncbi:predicted protein [Nematostella vectensis]|uniref:P2X purinoreceptor 7 intracellular domain-containing protein n=1 Tax=Nematostella vectensis TaxID=45351 RepID=A7S7E9_NEMVE|nr:predicted protein [Nematostella vectensis]|eukprot:XP_001632474.1 predicted protein [Nematostella vectensis]
MEESIEEEIERRTSDGQSVQARTSCNCKSTCSRKRVEDGARARGCPCKGANKHCNSSCKCGKRSKPCQNKQIENVCCGKRNCESTKARFGKLCLDVEVLSLGIRSSADIRNDRHDSSARAFRKAGYRNYILDKHGYLGKGRRRVAPSCIVWQIRHHYPTRTGIYMGFREN